MFPLRSLTIGQHLRQAIQGKICLKLLNASFKSHLSLENIYPDSNPDFLRRKKENEKGTSDGQIVSDKPPEAFSGYIPIESLEITTTRSSGPGGQGVNTSNSKVEIRFHLQSASWIPDWVKPKLITQEHNRLTKDGYMVVRSDMTRKQLLNQADCLNKIRHMIYTASIVPKQPSKEDKELHEKRKANIKAEVIREKKIKSSLKQMRSSPEMSL